MWWSNSRIGGAGSMPLGFITLLSGKGGHFDENETQNPRSLLRFLVTVVIELFFVLGCHDECCSRVIRGVI
jgi:hypothetical protein